MSSDCAMNRRDLLKNGGASFVAFAASSVLPGLTIDEKRLFPSKRPEPSARKFQSKAVEAFIVETSRQIAELEKKHAAFRIVAGPQILSEIHALVVRFDRIAFGERRFLHEALGDLVRREGIQLRLGIRAAIEADQVL